MAGAVTLPGPSPVVVEGNNPRHAAAAYAVATESDLQALIGALHRHLQAARADALDTGRVVTAASELGQNILRYAGRGQIAVRVGKWHGRSACELVAEDRGPGMADVALALQDNYTTGGGLGLGLPGVRRLMDHFELQSAPGSGTRVTVRKWL